MAFRFRKSINMGAGFRVNISKNGIGYSWGVKGFRVTKTAGGKVRSTTTIPGTGASYVEEWGETQKAASSHTNIAEQEQGVENKSVQSKVEGRNNMAQNAVIEGEYKGKRVVQSGECAVISGVFTKVRLDTSCVSAYYVMSENVRKSAMSGAARGLVGAALLGPIGAVAGLVSAKQKGTYRVAITFKNGKKSLLEVDDNLYGLIRLTLDGLDAPVQSYEKNEGGFKEENIAIVEGWIPDPKTDKPLIACDARPKETKETPAFSVADEILKLKELLDDEIITQEEFDKKKKQLLQLLNI